MRWKVKSRWIRKNIVRLATGTRSTDLSTWNLPRRIATINGILPDYLAGRTSCIMSQHAITMRALSGRDEKRHAFEKTPAFLKKGVKFCESSFNVISHLLIPDNAAPNVDLR